MPQDATGTCPECGRAYGLNADDRVRSHRAPGDGPAMDRPECRGARELPVPGSVVRG